MTGTTRFDSAQEYRQFVEMLARNGADRDEDGNLVNESPKTIAQTAVTDIEHVDGDDIALLHSAEPYVNDPVQQTRLFPKDVLMMHATDDWPDEEHIESVRDLAVELLADEIENAVRLQQQKADQ